MLVTGLPIPIIANNFQLYYTVSKLKKRLDERDELKRVKSQEVLNTMKNIMNKVNPLDKMKGLGNLGNKVKGLVAHSRSTSSLTPSSERKSLHGSKSSLAHPPSCNDSQTKILALPEVEREITGDLSEYPHSGGDGIRHAVLPPPHTLPPVRQVQPPAGQGENQYNDTTSVDVNNSAV